MVAFDYIHDPAAIYAQSFRAIEAEADLSRFDVAERAVAVRLIHACGMVGILDDLEMSTGAAAAGQTALEAGAAIFCDVEMVRHGIIRSHLPAGNPVLCTLTDTSVAEHARTIGNTRSAAAVDLWDERLAGAVVAIGNAPTALFRLLERVMEGASKPALIIGIPVGFVGAIESKRALAEFDQGIPYITVHGRRGGSAMAAAVVNALAGGSAA